VEDEVSGIVLAGGRSSRMGRDKALVEVGGRTLLERTVEVVGAVARPVFVLAGTQQALPTLVGATVLRDQRAFRGPLVALAEAAVHVTAPTALVVAVDHPRLSAVVLRALVSLLGSSGAAVFEEHVLTAVYATRTLLRAGEAVRKGERSVQSFLASVDVRRISRADLLSNPDVAREDPTLWSFADVDTPDDLRELSS
jgi:molybdopterin-guanine dinucleotide biosynthesis protein A